ncbi:DNA-binding transcriptional regulator, AcrR family [Salinihabitans flavidus]|uniref:DNA-binding transcriptional regulator, AcrR family n=1 Tax=Salinihabitans flavidus TaxID=569882 RepID=A0A1H8LH73_9RHOB|nr:TetR/AcrR family transcriptional regulator [Salinihabitans flavidus]SEO04467.1 DNA-binding transcriptional regulator, AcrR family [Salinihabitans flavidus]
MKTQAPAIHKGRKYQQVLDGARQIFMRDGFEGASVDDIARTAGVSKATLYKYFSDKRVLFMEMARIECGQQAQSLVDEVDFDAPVGRVLEQIGRGFLRIVLSDFGKRIFRICVAESDRFPELGRRFYESGPGAMRAGMIGFLTCAIQRGQLQIDDLELAADQFPELCRADLFPRLVFGLSDEFTEAEIDRVVKGAVQTFLARYAA